MQRHTMEWAYWFVGIVALGVFLCPASFMAAAWVGPYLELGDNAGSIAEAIWAWGSLGLLAGWATRWWPGVRSLGSLAELLIALIGSYIGGVGYILLLHEFFSWLDNSTYFSYSLLSVPIAFVSGVLLIVIARKYVQSRLRH